MKRKYFEIPKGPEWAWVEDGINQYCWLRDLRPMIRKLKPEQFSRKADPNVTRIGGMDIMLATWRSLGIMWEPIDYPLLEPYSTEMCWDGERISEGNRLYGREIRKCRLSGLRLNHQIGLEDYGIPPYIARMPRRLPTYWIKPVRTKLFDPIRFPMEPLVLTQELMELDPEIWVSDFLPGGFVSEWRAYIKQGKLVGLNHYSGDFLKFPDPGMVNYARTKLTASGIMPSCCAIDFGVRNLRPEPPTIVVEVNDFWALGNYGLDVQTYVQCCVERWDEIMTHGFRRYHEDATTETIEIEI